MLLKAVGDTDQAFVDQLAEAIREKQNEDGSFLCIMIKRDM